MHIKCVQTIHINLSKQTFFNTTQKFAIGKDIYILVV